MSNRTPFCDRAITFAAVGNELRGGSDSCQLRVRAKELGVVEAMCLHWAAALHAIEEVDRLIGFVLPSDWASHGFPKPRH